MIEKKFKIEAIPNFAAEFYALIAKKSPCIKVRMVFGFFIFKDRQGALINDF